MSNCKLCSREPAISIHTGLISCSNPDCYMDEVDLPQEQWDSLMMINRPVSEIQSEAIITMAREEMTVGRMHNDTMRSFVFVSDIHKYVDKLKSL